MYILPAELQGIDLPHSFLHYASDNFSELEPAQCQVLMEKMLAEKFDFLNASWRQEVLRIFSESEWEFNTRELIFVAKYEDEKKIKEKLRRLFSELKGEHIYSLHLLLTHFQRYK